MTKGELKSVIPDLPLLVSGVVRWCITSTEIHQSNLLALDAEFAYGANVCLLMKLC